MAAPKSLLILCLCLCMAGCGKPSTHWQSGAVIEDATLLAEYVSLTQPKGDARVIARLLVDNAYLRLDELPANHAVREARLKLDATEPILYPRNGGQP